MIRKRLLHALAIALLGVCPLLAQPASALVPRPPVNAPGVLDWGTLNLTGDQIRRINLLRLEFQRTAIRLRADIELRRIEIERLMIAPSADSNRLRAMVRAKLDLQAKMEFATLENFLAIKAILTATQLQRLPEARLMSSP